MDTINDAANDVKVSKEDVVYDDTEVLKVSAHSAQAQSRVQSPQSYATRAALTFKP